MKRPSFQFYPSDWLRDTALRTCSIGARGLWIDMICFMHEGNPYGVLKVGNKVILPANLAVMVGATLLEVEGWLNELESSQVFERGDDGEIMSRRMIRDENLRNARAEGGKLGGNPALKVKDKVNLKVNQKPTPSSSSSTSSTTSLLLETESSVKKKKTTNKENRAVSQNTDLMIRIGSWFRRRPDTLWTVMEKEALDSIQDCYKTEKQIDGMEAYYTSEDQEVRKWLKRDLITLLNNWTSQLDRARNFDV